MNTDQYEILVSAAKKKDTNAFSKLYKLVYMDLYKFAFYTLKNKEDAEDIVSDTVLSAFHSINKLRKNSSFKYWIFKILTNKCKSKLKEYSKEKLLPLDNNIEFLHKDLSESNDLKNAFSTLSSEERLMISLSIFAGYTSIEISKILKVNANTVRSKISRGLKKMEPLLK